MENWIFLNADRLRNGGRGLPTWLELDAEEKQEVPDSSQTSPNQPQIPKVSL